MMSITLSSEELSLLKVAFALKKFSLGFKSSNRKHIKDVDREKEHLNSSIKYIEEFATNNTDGFSVILSTDIVLDIIDCLFEKIECLNKLIVSNIKDGFDANEYEEDKKKYMHLYSKVMNQRLISNLCNTHPNT